MLCITRKIGQSIVIDGQIKVQLLEVRGKTAKFGVEYPAGNSVLRGELFERIQQENQHALNSAQVLKKIWK